MTRVIYGNASLTVVIREGTQILALGERVTTEQACELVAAILPVQSPYPPSTPLRGPEA